MHRLPEVLHYWIEKARTSVARWLVGKRVKNVVDSGFDLDNFYDEVASEQLRDIIWYNFSWKKHGRFLVIWDEIYSDLRPFDPKELDSIGTAMWIMLIYPKGTSHILIPSLQKRYSFDGLWNYQEASLAVSDEHGINPEIIAQLHIDRLSASNRVLTSTVDIHNLLELLDKRFPLKKRSVSKKKSNTQ